MEVRILKQPKLFISAKRINLFQFVGNVVQAAEVVPRLCQERLRLRARSRGRSAWAPHLQGAFTYDIHVSFSEFCTPSLVQIVVEYRGHSSNLP